jgi:hypothetical protein
LLQELSKQENIISALREKAKARKMDWKRVQKALSSVECDSSDAESQHEEGGAEGEVRPPFVNPFTPHITFSFLDKTSGQNVVLATNTPPQYKRKSAPTRDDDHLESQENSTNEQAGVRKRGRPAKRTKNGMPAASPGFVRA